VGESLVFPGVHRRLDHLAERGRTAGAVVIGAVGMFFIAALIEGFFRQLVDGLVARATLAFATGTVWLFYFTMAGARRRGGAR